MIRPPSAADLLQIGQLWLAMQREWRQTAWQGRETKTMTVPSPAGDGADKGTSSKDDPYEAALLVHQAEYEQQLRKWYRDDKTFMLVGARDVYHENAGEIVAYSIARIEDVSSLYDRVPGGVGSGGTHRFGRIVDLYVRPSLRGNNLARRMLEATAGWMRAQQCAFLEADVLTSNRSGMGFLASTGFQLHSSTVRKQLR